MCKSLHIWWMGTKSWASSKLIASSCYNNFPQECADRFCIFCPGAELFLNVTYSGVLCCGEGWGNMCDILFLMTTLSLHLATINLRQDFAITNTYNEQRKKGIRCMKHYLWFMKILDVMNKIAWLFTQKSLGSSIISTQMYTLKPQHFR